MSLKYRLVAEFVDDDSLVAAERAFGEWLKTQKGLAFNASRAERTTPREGVEISVERGTSSTDAIVRFGLHEETAKGRWSTTLTSMRAETESWVWLDLEWVSEDPWGAEPTVKPPRLVDFLIGAGRVRIGPVALSVQANHLQDASAAVELATLVLDETRTSPVVVLSHDYKATHEDAAERGRRLARELAGIAPVYVLDSAATNSFNTKLPEAMKTYGGAARTYLPASDVAQAPMARHRVLGSKWFVENPRRAAEMIAAPLVLRNLSARPPASYRHTGRALLRPASDEANADMLLADALAAEKEADKAIAEAAIARDELEWEAELHRESEALVDRYAARIRFLEAELSEADRYLTGVETPDAFESVDVETFDDLVRESRARLSFLVLGDVDEAAAALDQFAAAASWARRSWRALCALDEYAGARSKGWSGDFKSWCLGPKTTSSLTVPANWVALSESDSVDKNSKYRGPRIFPVPVEVHKSGFVYMSPHIKIVEGGRPAPRIHFWDDSAGTKKVYVGYIGAHLPNGKKN